jgi:hypothetical protein
MKNDILSDGACGSLGGGTLFSLGTSGLGGLGGLFPFARVQVHTNTKKSSKWRILKYALQICPSNNAHTTLPLSTRSPYLQRLNEIHSLKAYFVLVHSR